MEDLIYHLRLLISLFGFYFLVACEKNEDFLPAKTFEGRNTFGYIVSPNYDEPVYGGSFDGNDTAYFANNKLHCNFVARTGNGWTGFEVCILKLLFDYQIGNQEFIFEDAAFGIGHSGSAGLDVISVNDLPSRHYLDSTQSNIMDIRYFNPGKAILAANFDLYLTEYDTIVETVYTDSTSYDTTIVKIGGTYHLYDGRFDVRYNY